MFIHSDLLPMDDSSSDELRSCERCDLQDCVGDCVCGDCDDSECNGDCACIRCDESDCEGDCVCEGCEQADCEGDCVCSTCNFQACAGDCDGSVMAVDSCSLSELHALSATHDLFAHTLDGQCLGAVRVYSTGLAIAV